MDGYNLEDYIYSLQTRNGNDQDYSGIFSRKEEWGRITKFKL